MLAPISSVPVARVWRFLLTCSDAAETTSACAISSASALICWLTPVSCSAALASDCAFSAMFEMLARMSVINGKPFANLTDRILARHSDIDREIAFGGRGNRIEHAVHFPAQFILSRAFAFAYGDAFKS